jgi:hemoglobin-like flavoprotein
MTPRQIELVQSSFNMVVPNLESAAMTFYDRLFQLDPSLRHMFHGPQAEQARRLGARADDRGERAEPGAANPGRG